ncbi:hypothetical protein [Paraburkholderia graminis]
MRRIDALYDIPQFAASTFVRRIAGNNFRLPAPVRERYRSIPNKVVENIERIVLAAYVEAGEAVGGDASREHLLQQALDGRRAMVASGELLSLIEFKRRVGMTGKRLAELLDDGRLFAVRLDGVEYLPAVLADPSCNRRRLHAICRIIVPAPPLSRFNFLMSENGSLCDRRPLDMLEDDNDFESLKRLAEAWAAQWSRTAVRLYDGEHETEPTDGDALYTAMAEIDPRRPLWERASEVLHVHGYQWPLGPYPDVRSFTLFVERHTAGGAAPTPEACVQILVDGEHIRIRIVAAPGATLRSRTMPTGNHKGLIDIAKRVIAHLTNAKRA